MNDQRLFKIIFICLIIASIVHAETVNEPNLEYNSYKPVPSVSQEQPPNESNSTISSDVCDVNVQGLNETQRLLKINVRKWRMLKRGMTLSDVKKLLGDPKLSQASSHECFLFYQETPFFNAKPNFSYRTSSKQIINKDRYGNITDKIGINDVGGVKNGALVFEAKTMNEFIAELHDECERKVKNFTGNFDKYNNTKSNNRDQHYAPNVGGSSREARGAANAKRLASDGDTRIANARNAAKNDQSDEIEKIKNEYDGRIAALKEERTPRSPIYILKYFNQPDWNNIKTLLEKNITIGNSNRLKEKQQVQINWKKLQLNMTQQQVEKLLGQSTRFESNIQGTKLFYGSEAQCGELFLSSRSDSTEQLTSWTEPFWGKKIIPAILLPQGVQFFKGKILQHISTNIILANPISSTYWQFTFDDPNGNIIYTQTIPAIADEIIAIELHENHFLLTKPNLTEFSIYVSPIGLHKYVATGGNSSTIKKFAEYEISSIDGNSIKTLINREI